MPSLRDLWSHLLRVQALTKPWNMLEREGAVEDNDSSLPREANAAAHSSAAGSTLHRSLGALDLTLCTTSSIDSPCFAANQNRVFRIFLCLQLGLVALLVRVSTF
jgi:hypothetical protein